MKMTKIIFALFWTSLLLAPYSVRAGDTGLDVLTGVLDAIQSKSKSSAGSVFRGIGDAFDNQESGQRESDGDRSKTGGKKENANTTHGHTFNSLSLEDCRKAGIECSCYGYNTNWCVEVK